MKNSSDVIPLGTTRVIVETKRIYSIPSLPASLTVLICNDCTSLHELPPLSHCVSLTQLRCTGCTSLRKLPPLPMSLEFLTCSGCTSLLYLPTISHTCIYYGPSFLPTEKKYFEEANMGKNQEFIDITDVVKGYLS
jgi:hypothetical protein